MIEYKCPHCGTELYDPRFTGFKLGCPIQTCPQCQKEYNHPYIYEWSIISPFHKFFYVFIYTGGFVLAGFMADNLIEHNWYRALFFFVIWIIYGIVRLIILDSDKIKKSFQRTRNNPEYIKKLSDLGCTSIDIRIDPFYK